MKRALSVAALVLALTGSALAADLPSYKAPPPPPLPPPPLWTGFYVGLNAGGTWANSNSVTTGVAPIATNGDFPHGGGAAQGSSYLAAMALTTSGTVPINGGGFIGGGQIGYNWQFYNSFVAGVEADIQGVAGSGSSRSLGTAAPVTLPQNAGEAYVGGISSTKRLDYIGTVRGRLGWLFTPTLLAYGTGGLAYGGVQTSTSVFNANTVLCCGHLPPVFGASAFSDTRVGWTAGAGLEWMFMPHWSAKVEYLYYDLGTVNSGFFIPAVDTVSGFQAFFAGQSRARFNGNIVRAGVNYHFNWGAAPVVAKY
jgi:outer membrane immunogenic protein